MRVWKGQLGDCFINTRSLLLQCLPSKTFCHRQQRSSKNVPRISMLASPELILHPCIMGLLCLSQSRVRGQENRDLP